MGEINKDFIDYMINPGLETGKELMRQQYKEETGERAIVNGKYSSGYVQYLENILSMTFELESDEW